MADKRQIEIFSAGCAVCEDWVAMVRAMACPSCEVTVADMSDPKVARRAQALGIQAVPAVVVDGAVAACCTGRGPDAGVLRDAGIGQPLG